MQEILVVIIATILSGVFAMIVSWMTARYSVKLLEPQLNFKIEELDAQVQANVKQFEEQIEIESRRDTISKRAIIQDEYIDPLRIAIEDVLTAYGVIDEKFEKADQGYRGDIEEFVSFLSHIITSERNNPEKMVISCNYEWYFVVSTLYITFILFARLSKIREQLPFRHLTNEENQLLIRHVGRVREAFGDRHGIWTYIQDSTGALMINDNGEFKKYKEFCEMIVDPHQWVWFYQPIEFYKMIEAKREYQFRQIQSSLNSLLSILGRFEHPYSTNESDSP